MGIFSSLVKMENYQNSKWGVPLVYPRGWEIMWENEPDGNWEIVVGIAGKPTSSGRSCLTLRVMRDALLNFGPSHVSVYAAGGPGEPAEIPRSPQEFNEGAKQSLSRMFPGFKTVSETTGSLAGMPSATLVYSYRGQGGPIREKQFNLFAPTATYRLLSESPESQAKFTEEYFDTVVSGFKPFLRS